MVTSIRLKNRLGLAYELEDCEGMVHVSRKCVFCQNNHTVEVDTPIRMLQRRWGDWVRNGPIQDAFPHMPANDREFLISSICPMCFDACAPDD